MKIRLARRSDIKGMLRVTRKAFPKEDAAKEIGDMFSRSFSRPTYVVAVEDGEVVGLAGFIQSWFDFNIYEIFWVGVMPDFRRRGVGRKIVCDAVRRIKLFKGHSKASMIVLSTECPGFFVKCGFRKAAKLPGNKGVLMVVKPENK